MSIQTSHISSSHLPHVCTVYCIGLQSSRIYNIYIQYHVSTYIICIYFYYIRIFYIRLYLFPLSQLVFIFVHFTSENFTNPQYIVISFPLNSHLFFNRSEKQGENLSCPCMYLPCQPFQVFLSMYIPIWCYFPCSLRTSLNIVQSACLLLKTLQLLFV